MEKFYMVLDESTGYTKYKHNNYNGALVEAKRLAIQNTGKEFVVLCAIARAKTDNVIVEEVPIDDIPF